MTPPSWSSLCRAIIPIGSMSSDITVLKVLYPGCRRHDRTSGWSKHLTPAIRFTMPICHLIKARCDDGAHSDTAMQHCSVQCGEVSNATQRRALHPSRGVAGLVFDWHWTQYLHLSWAGDRCLPRGHTSVVCTLDATRLQRCAHVKTDHAAEQFVLYSMRLAAFVDPPGLQSCARWCSIEGPMLD